MANVRNRAKCDRRRRAPSAARRKRQRVVYRPTLLRRGPLCRPLRLLSRLAQAGAARRPFAARPLRFDQFALRPRARGSSGRDPEKWTASQRTASGSRTRWRRLSPKAVASCVKTASVPWCSPTRPSRGLVGCAAVRNDPRGLDNHRLLAHRYRGGFSVPARATAARATSLHLVCRPRSEGASIGDWPMYGASYRAALKSGCSGCKAKGCTAPT